jgi:hypothetical protein
MYKPAIRIALLGFALVAGNASAFYGTPPVASGESAAPPPAQSAGQSVSSASLDNLFRTSDFSVTLGG